MRTVILLAAVLMYGSAPVYAHKGMQRIASAVKSKAGQFVVTGAIASALLFTVPTGVEAGQHAEAVQQDEIETKKGIDWDKWERELPDIIARAVAETDAILGHRTEQYLNKMQQLIDGLQADAGQIVTAKLRFPFPDAGLLDNLPASVHKLEVSRIKRDLRSLMTQIDAIALPMGQADDLFAYFYNSGKEIEKLTVMTHAHLLAQSKTYRRAVERLEKEALRKRYLYTIGQSNESTMWYSRAHGVSAKGLSTNPSNIDAALLHLRVQYDKAVALAQEVDSGETDRKSELAIELGILQERAEQTLRVIEKTERDKAKQRRRLWRFGR